MRAKVIGSATIPRLSVFRSNKHIVAQLIDDHKGVTIAVADDMARKEDKKKGTKSEAPVVRAEKVGEEIAKIALGKKIDSVKFDRGGYRYHGIVRAVAEGARKGGLKF